MRLLLVRHAEAVVLGEAGSTCDFDRPLTDLGRKQAAALAAALGKFGLAPDRVVTSPLLRATQTAEPLLTLLPQNSGPAILCDYLAVEEFRPKKLVQAIEEAGGKRVALVGHMPSIARYAAWMLGCPEGTVDFKKGAIASIKFRPGVAETAGELEYLITPDWYLDPC